MFQFLELLHRLLGVIFGFQQQESPPTRASVIIMRLVSTGVKEKLIFHGDKGLDERLRAIMPVEQ